MYFPFLSKSPGKRIPSRFPNGTLWREIPACRAFLHICLSQRPKEKSVPPCSPQAGPLWKQTPIPEPYLAYLSASPVKELSLQVPSWSPLGERCPVSRALLYSSFKVPRIRAPLPIPGSPRAERGANGERCPIRSLSLHIFQSPQ
jgi:hypothetical protein